jgi:hypothetical protein
MGTEQPRWYRVGSRQPRIQDCDDRTDQRDTTDNHHVESSTPIAARERSLADCDGAMVARSQILVSGSTATLSGTLTNETDFDVYFCGLPPYATLFGTDGIEPILLGDFNSPPRAQPPYGDWVIHPRASVPYRSLPITLQTPDPLWDGTHWCTSSQSTTLEITFCDQRKVSAIQVIT